MSQRIRTRRPMRWCACACVCVHMWQLTAVTIHPTERLPKEPPPPPTLFPTPTPASTPHPTLNTRHQQRKDDSPVASNEGADKGGEEEEEEERHSSHIGRDTEITTGLEVGLPLALQLFPLLLRFHDPALARQLERESIGPELYATAWLVTALARCGELLETSREQSVTSRCFTIPLNS